MVFGSNGCRYQLVPGWGRLPHDWEWGIIPAVACDSKDRVYVYSRSEHPLVVFDREGNYLSSWGEGLYIEPHGIFIDAEDCVYLADDENHCIYKYSSEGQLIKTLGTPGQPAPPGQPFNKPTNLATASNGDLIVSDGYVNRRVHRFSPDGKLLLSWGTEGQEPGQFALPHSVAIDKDDQVWICDRNNNRIQIFDLEGNFLQQWTGLDLPSSLCFDPAGDLLYLVELTQRFSIYKRDGTLITSWGDKRESTKPGEFLGGPHGVCLDSRGDLYIAEAFVPGRLQKFARLD